MTDAPPPVVMTTAWQVFDIKRKLVAATKGNDIDLLERLTSLPRHWIVDAYVMCADDAIPGVRIHSYWLDWRKTTGIDYKPFTLYVRERLQQQEQR